MKHNKIFKRTQRKLLGTITHVTTDEPIVALTFDDGPHPVYTTAVLELLARYNAQATFFIVGKAAQEQPQLVQRILQAGHALGNHSWDHPAFPELDWRARQEQIRAWEHNVGRQPNLLFRPPWGLQSSWSRLTLFWLGYQVITWNVAPEDWLWQEPGALAERIIQAATPGSIILLHDAIYQSQMEQPQYDRQYMITGLENALNVLSHRFRFVTVPQLLAIGRPVRRMWLAQGTGNHIPISTETIAPITNVTAVNQQLHHQ